jgi:peptidoglycan hydrolase-like protein with peptidoglycan-binding domain
MLKTGSRGEDVANLQRLLKLKGFDPGQVDGAFGPITRAALESLQAAAGLEVDGIYGPKSEAALKAWAMGAGPGAAEDAEDEEPPSVPRQAF